MRDDAVAARDAVSRNDVGEMNDRHASPTDFERLAERAISRRGFLCGTTACGATAFVLGAGGMVVPPARAGAAGLDFTPVAANGLDTVTVPEGYSWQVVARWGDPLWSGGAAFDHATRGTGESQEAAFGDNCDGMALFSNGEKSVLAVNNEYTNLKIAFANRESQGSPRPPTTCASARPATVSPSSRSRSRDGAWGIVQDSPYNRRITPDTPMAITGPARGHDMMKTAADPDGTTALGTWNNCGNGRTPWGTYLACEEEFQRLLLIGRSRLRAARRLQALRYQGGRSRICLGNDGRALRRLQAPQRAAPRRLRGRDRPAGPRIHTQEAHCARPL